MFNVVGVDPGAKGALVWLDEVGNPKGWLSMPMIEKGGPYGQSIVCVPSIKIWFEALPKDVRVFVERPQLFGVPTSAAFTMGFNFGLLLRALPAHEFVEPSEWTKFVHADQSKDLKPKAKSEIVFADMFPVLNKEVTKKKFREGVIDAALIAAYGIWKLDNFNPKESDF